MTEDTRAARRAELLAELHRLGPRLLSLTPGTAEHDRLVEEMRPVYMALFALEEEATA